MYKNDKNSFLSSEIYKRTLRPAFKEIYLFRVKGNLNMPTKFELCRILSSDTIAFYWYHAVNMQVKYLD